MKIQSRPLLLVSILLMVLLIGLTTAVSRAERNQLTNTNVGGPITQNTTWTVAGSPYIATSSVVVMTGVTLTIEPGVEVRFQAQRALVINGTLDARGTEMQPIVFTANTDEPEPGYWGYIQFGDTFQPPTTCGNPDCPTMQHVIVEYGGYTASDARQAAVDVQYAVNVWIDHSIIQHNQHTGIMAQNANIHISNSEVAYNKHSGVIVNSDIYPSPVINVHNNHIHHNAFSAHTKGGGGILLDGICYVSGYIVGYISNNIIEYNFTDQLGGGLFHYGCTGLGRHIVLSNNIIRHNVAASSGGLHIEGDALLQGNQVYDNIGYNQVCYTGDWGCMGYQTGVGGVAVRWGILIAEDNIIINNIAPLSDETLTGGLFYQPPEVSIDHYQNQGELASNIISGNVGGGMYVHPATQSWDQSASHVFVTDNTIAFNKAVATSGLRTKTFGFPGVLHRMTIQRNTIMGNVSQNHSDMNHTAVCAHCMEASQQPFLMDITHNNMWSNQTPYVLSYGLGQGSPNLNATQNWWGTTNQSVILDQIFDFFDDSAYAIVDFSNFLTGPNLDAPPSPPANLQVTPTSNSFQLSWSANPESDIIGYKVYYADRKGYPYEGSGANEGNSGRDVGNVTVFALTGLPANQHHYFTVTAYDQDGNESWHSLEARAAIGEVPFRNGDFELGDNGDWLAQDDKLIFPSSVLPSGVKPFSGDFVALLGWRNEHSLSQVFRVPAEGAILRYRYIFWDRRSSGNDLCRFGAVEIRINNEVVENFDPYITHPPSWFSKPNCVGTLEQGWQTREFDISVYAGQTIVLEFYIDSIAGNALILDDIELLPPGSPSPYQPQLTISNSAGAPGSYFRLEGMDFPPDAVVGLAVNGTSLQPDPWSWYTQTISTGYAPIILETAHDIPPGSYEVVVSAASASGSVSASTVFTIDVNADYHWESTNNSIQFFVPADLGSAPPILNSNYSNGAPGSHFAVTAANFPPNSPATISVNGNVLTTINTDAAGLATFILRTGASLAPGLYNVSFTVNPVASVTIQINPGAPVRPLVGNGPVIDIPDTIEPLDERFVYLPLVIR